MHLGFLIETMRREGYEVSVGKPEVIFHQQPDGSVHEPIEMLTMFYVIAMLATFIAAGRRGLLAPR